MATNAQAAVVKAALAADVTDAANKMLSGQLAFIQNMTTPRKEVSIEIRGTYWRADGNDPACGSDVNGAAFPPGNSLCGRPCLDIPSNATITSFEILSIDSSGTVQCSLGVNCPNGWSKWWSTPERYEKGDKATVCGNFKNWSHDRARTGKMVIHFAIPSNAHKIDQVGVTKTGKPRPKKSGLEPVNK
jgi:hypothetical protein